MSDKFPKQPPNTPSEAIADQQRAESCESYEASLSTPDAVAASADKAAGAEVDAATMAAEPDAVDTLAAEQAAPAALWEAQLNEARDRNLRLQAELENVRKRMLRTVEEERRYACLPLMRDVLPVVDNLQRAIEAAEQHENATALLEGVKLVVGQLHAALERHHCTPIVAHGAVFDPHVHEAIAQLPSPDHEPGHVCLVTQAGYQLYDRVIRPAQVIVAAPRETAADASEETTESGT